MPRFSTNISVMFHEHDFLSRFQVAKDNGFDAIEIQFPYEIPLTELLNAKDSAGVEITVINVGAGDLSIGGPGIAGYPGREDQFKVAVEKAHKYADKLKPVNINVLAGFPPLDQFERRQCLDVLASNLNYAAAILEETGATVLTEAINTNDRPGFLVSSTSAAVEIIKHAGHKNLAIQYDIYHMQIMEGNLVNTIRDNLDWIGHIQFADTPGRNEPGTGEINFPFLFHAIDEMGWTGWLGAEYIPSQQTEHTLNWMPAQAKQNLS